MIKYKIFLIISVIILNGCVGVSSSGVLGTGVSIATDPRTIGTQIDDNIMQKNLSGKIVNMNAKYLLSVKPKVIDGRIFITGKVNIKEEFKFQQYAKDLLITSQLRTAMIASKKIKSSNYNIDTHKKKIYIYGIAQSEDERAEVINEAKQILDVEDVISSILLVEDLRIIKN